jgi:hypothetical protein
MDLRPLRRRRWIGLEHDLPLRVARGDIADERPIALRAFRARRRRGGEAIDALRPFHAPFAPAKGFVRWSSVAAFALEEHDAGRVRYNALLANLLLESVVVPGPRTGRSAQAYSAMERLAAQIAVLRPGERGFFHAGIARSARVARRQPRRAPAPAGGHRACVSTGRHIYTLGLYGCAPNREKPCAQKSPRLDSRDGGARRRGGLHGCGSDDQHQ